MTRPCAYIKMMVTSLGIENCTVGCRASDEEIVFELDCGDDYGIVIGRRGETLDAIQYLARMSANRGISGYKRVSINIGNYREKREASLRSLAIKTATRAVKTGRSITLEPMNPYERRIIHTAVQEVPGAVSFSTGMDLDRRVVISTEERRNNRQRGGDRREDRRDNHRDNRREKYTPKAPAEGRAPKSDAAGTSLYGRIDVKKD